MLLQIDGWYGAGKSVLNGLLDSHPQIGVNPLHDATHMAFLMDGIHEVLLGRDIEALRRLLGKTQYYIFERAALLGEGSVSFGSGIECKTPFKFDFYAFDKEWIAGVMALKTWEAEDLIVRIYRKYNEYLNNKGTCIYFMSMSWPLIDLQSKYSEEFPNSKSILVKREIAEIIAVRSGRKPRDFNGKDIFFAPGFEKLIQSGEVNKIVDYYAMFSKQSQLFPNNFLSVDFNDLIFNRKETMIKVSNFLKIDFDETMMKWTFLGDEIKYNGMSYVDKINDTADKILTREQLNTIYKLEKQKNAPIKLSSIINKSSTFLKILAQKLEKNSL